MQNIEKLEEMLEEHIEKSEITAKKVSDIHFILMGNPEAKIPGLADKVHRHEKYIDADKKLKWTISGILTGANIGFWAWVKSHLGL